MRIETGDGLDRTVERVSCIRSSGWMRIETCQVWHYGRLNADLHPVFGLDED